MPAILKPILGGGSGPGGDFLPLSGGTLTGPLFLSGDATQALQAVTFEQLQAAQFGFLAHAPVVAATAAAIVGTYNNGASGVGATITTTATGVQTIDGHTPSLNDRVLIQTQVAAADNGIYTVSILGTTGVSQVYTRALDFDTVGSGGVATGAYVIVNNGDTYMGDTIWMTSQAPFTIGTTPLNWSILTVPGSLTFSGNLTQTGNNVTLSNPLTGLINFATQRAQFANGSGIQDSNANPILLVDGVASAINYVTLTNAANGGFPIFSSATTAGDTPHLGLASISGTVIVGSLAGNAGLLAIANAAVDAFIGITVPDPFTAYVLTLPDSSGTANTTFINDGTGVLTWGAILTNPMTTAGDIIRGGSSGTPQRLAPGSEGEVLTIVSGVPAYAPNSGSGGALQFITSSIASSTPSVEFTGLSSAYSSYIIKMVNVIPEDIANIQMRVSTDGTTYLGTSVYAENYTQSNGGGVSVGTDDIGSPENSFIIVGAALPAAGAYGVSSVLELLGAGVTDSILTYFASSNCVDEAGNIVQTNTAGSTLASTTNILAVQISMSSGNMVSGTFTLYGVLAS